MTNAMRKVITEAIESGTDRIGPWVHENVFWALRSAGYANDSGWITEKGRQALGPAAMAGR